MNTLILTLVNFLKARDAFAQGSVPTSVATSPTLTNPLASAGINSLPEFIEMILKFVVDIGTPLVAVAFIWTGLQYVLAQGNPEKIKKAHQTAKYTVYGAILILGAFVITKVVSATIGSVIS